ncbi:MAG: GNAT family N-acetyltransferase [Allobranchiibius sp.]
MTTTTLRMMQQPTTPSRALPDGARIDQVKEPTPEFARWLYAAVGGPWRWTDRLGWNRQEWADGLARPGAELYVLYSDGAPAGYVQLDAVADDPGESPSSSVEITYFGLMEHAIGQGLGGALLGYGIARAWSVSDRRGLPPVENVWVHTCNLDGPHAIANYQARGFAITDESTAEQEYPAQALGAWASTGGPS